MKRPASYECSVLETEMEKLTKCNASPEARGHVSHFAKISMSELDQETDYPSRNSNLSSVNAMFEKLHLILLRTSDPWYANMKSAPSTVVLSDNSVLKDIRFRSVLTFCSLAG